jgi:hypothetical protein
MDTIQLPSETVVKKTESIFFRTIRYFLSIQLLIIPVLIYGIYINYNSDILMINTAEREKLILSAGIASKALKNIDSDLIFLSKSEHLKEIIEDKNKNTIQSLQKLFYNFSEAKIIYDQIRYLDMNGMEIVRVNYSDGKPQIVAESQLQNKNDRYYFRDTYELDSGEIFISPLDLNVENGKVETPYKPMLRIGIPIFNEKGQKRGIIILNYLAENMLKRIRQMYVQSQNSFISNNITINGDNLSTKINSMPLFINSNGDFLIGESPKDEWSFMLEHGTTIKEKYNNAWSIMHDSLSAQIKTCKGLFTYTTIYPLENFHKSSSGSGTPFSKSDSKISNSGYFWKVSSFIKDNELSRILNSTLKMSAIILSFISLIILIISYLLAKSNYLKKMAMNRVKTLNGLLPICSSCKKIRDDNGYWDELEGYICDHSEADFSHSICPECVSKLYPHLDIPQSLTEQVDTKD